MSRRPGIALRTALGFAPAITAGLVLAVAVELVAGDAWKRLRPGGATLAKAPADPAGRAAPRTEPPPASILAPVSVYDWPPGKGI